MPRSPESRLKSTIKFGNFIFEGFYEKNTSTANNEGEPDSPEQKEELTPQKITLFNTLRTWWLRFTTWNNS